MNKNNIAQSLISSILTAILVLANPLSALAQTQNGSSYTLEEGTKLVLRVDETFNAAAAPDAGSIVAKVEYDVYSDDGTTVLIKEGSRATINYNIERAKSWGRPGKLCITDTSTKTVDNKKIQLYIGNCRQGNNNVAPVVIISVLFFPIGLFSGFIKGKLPEIPEGMTINASVAQDIYCNPTPK